MEVPPTNFPATIKTTKTTGNFFLSPPKIPDILNIKIYTRLLLRMVQRMNDRSSGEKKTGLKNAWVNKWINAASGACRALPL
jgi:hypothetical protein